MRGLKKLKTNEKRYERIMAYLQIAVGCVIGGAAYPMFLVPNSIAPGGLTGVATILNHLFGLPVGTTSLALNVPLFIIGYRAMGRIFAFRSLVATVLFSLAIDLIRMAPVTTDPLLGTLYGGVLLGAGLGLILRGSATTGGTDMVARMVHRRWPSLSVGTFLFAIDFLVVIAAGLLMGISEALYALICIFVSSKVIDVVMIGFTGNKACYIISERWERVSDRILNELDRGATLMTARGAYSRADRPVILCVVGRAELPRLKAIVHEEDASAFMFVTEAHEALGEGFSRLDQPD